MTPTTTDLLEQLVANAHALHQIQAAAVMHEQAIHRTIHALLGEGTHRIGPWNARVWEHTWEDGRTAILGIISRVEA